MSELQIEKSYLEFSDESKNSHKFYEVTVQDKRVTFRFGRIGDNGQIQTESYETHEKARIEAKKKINSKLKKGYRYAVIGQTEKRTVPRKPKPAFEEQFQNLQDCDIQLRLNFSVEALFEEWSKEEFEKEPYELLLIALGGETETGHWEWEFLSDDIWHFDTECIEDHGDYIRIAQRMKDLSHGDLKLENIEDYVDVEEEIAWLEFDLNGEKYHWDLEVDNDWVDTEIFQMFIELLEKQKTDKKYTYFDLRGQDCLIGCCTPQQLEKLRNVTELDFIWLS